MEWNMSHRLRISILTFAFCFNAIIGLTQASSASEKVWTDESWKNAKEGIEFKENKKEEEKEDKKTEIDLDDFVDNDWDWNFDWLKRPITKTIIILLAVVGLGFMLAYLLRKSSLEQDLKVPEDMLYSLEKLEDDVPKSDFDKFLEACIRSGDYKTAVRVLYLQLLQQMHQNEWIIWKKNKTNREFLNEIRGKSTYKTIRDLTLAYEIVWYGEQTVTSTQFEMLQKAFIDVNAIVRNEKK